MTERNINLTNFLPPAMDGGELSEFVGVFQTFLSSAYSQPTSSSILESIENLTTLQDTYEVPKEYIPLLANNLGAVQTPNFGKLVSYYEALGEATSAATTIAETTIRQYLSNLARIYTIKSSNISLTFLVGLFGLNANVYVMWTNDYDQQWRYVNPRTNLYTSAFETGDLLPTNGGYYPSPHFSILFDDDNDELEFFEIVASTILDLINTYRPVNTVFDGFGIYRNFISEDGPCVSGGYTGSTFTIDISATN